MSNSTPSIRDLISSERSRILRSADTRSKEQAYELEMAQELFVPLQKAAQSLRSECREIIGQIFEYEEAEPLYWNLGDGKPACERGVYLSVRNEPIKIYIRVQSKSHPKHRYELATGTGAVYTLVKYRNRRSYLDSDRTYPDAVDRVTEYPSAEEAVDAAASFFAAQIAARELESGDGALSMSTEAQKQEAFNLIHDLAVEASSLNNLHDIQNKLDAIISLSRYQQDILPKSSKPAGSCGDDA